MVTRSMNTGFDLLSFLPMVLPIVKPVPWDKGLRDIERGINNPSSVGQDLFVNDEPKADYMWLKAIVIPGHNTQVGRELVGVHAEINKTVKSMKKAKTKLKTKMMNHSSESEDK